MPSPKVSDFTTLLGVFRQGLILGMVSVNDIRARADNIILNTNEPDYFFIEIALTSDRKALLSIFNKYVTEKEGLLVYRVLMGLMYKKLLSKQLSVNNIIFLMESIIYTTDFTLFEIDCLNNVSDDHVFWTMGKIPAEPKDVPALEILGYYKNFTLENYDQWDDINKLVEETLRIEEVKSRKRNAAFQKAYKKERTRKATIRTLKGYALKSVLYLIIFSVVIISAVISQLKYYYMFSSAYIFILCGMLVWFVNFWRRWKKKYKKI